MQSTARDLVRRLLRVTKSVGSPQGLNVIAFSGGVDSSLVSQLVHEVYPSNSIAVLGRSPAVPASQIDIARDVAVRDPCHDLLLRRI